MLTPKQFADIPTPILNSIIKIEDRVLKDIANTIAQGIKLEETDKYRIKTLMRLGYKADDIDKRLRKELEALAVDTEQLVLDAGELAYKQDKELYKKGGIDLPKHDAHITTLVNQYATNSKDDMLDIASKVGIQKGKRTIPLERVYRDEINRGIIEVHTGLYSHDDAIKRVVRNIANRGLTVYEDGRNYDLYSATRSLIITNVNRMTSLIQEYNIKNTGVELVETSAHMGARPDHALWQGQVFSYNGDSKEYPDFIESTRYGEVDGLGGINCRHTYFPFFKGISERAYTDKELQELDPKPFKYEGKTYNSYEATQRQRYYERNIRKMERFIKAYEGAGLKEDKNLAEIKKQVLLSKYKDFSKVAGIRPKLERL